MFKYYFERIENIEIAPLISLTIFFVFFLLLIIRLILMDKDHVEKMKNMPVDGNDLVNSNTSDHEES